MLSDTKPTVLKLVIGVVVAAATLAVALIFVTLRAEASARAALQDRLESERVLAEFMEVLTDAETGQRGYLLTGDRAYLAPYQGAVSRIGALQSSAVLAELDPSGDLLRLSESKVAELAQTIEYYDTGRPETALALVNTDAGQETMSEIRERVAAITALSRDAVDTFTNRADVLGERLNIALVLLGVILAAAILSALYFFRRAARTERAEAGRQRMEVLANELDHRMKNLFTVATSLVNQSARGRGPEVEDFAKEVRGRLHAMSGAYSMTRELGDARSMPSSEIVDKVVRAQLLPHHILAARGQQDAVRETSVTPLSLILHEWTTNALKYGAWQPTEDGGAKGSVDVSWEVTPEGRFQLLWDEDNPGRGEAAPARAGYGSRLVKMCAQQLGGMVDYDWHRDGVRIRLDADAGQMGLVTG